MIQKSKPLRSEAHRRIVAALACSMCGTVGQSQAAHANFGKGFGIKACDSQTFPACIWCHRFIDQGGRLTKDDRRALEASYVNKTREILMRLHLWSDQIEGAFQRADKYFSVDSDALL